ncbi:MAG: HAD-IIIA family hydrolase [Armatimonadota bacterium]|nr:HAD-IIIA family hydrolase [bacterium]MDW8321601.1 HAD-IIIA family hydrolase [Armatimonadota bacterium]
MIQQHIEADSQPAWSERQSDVLQSLQAVKAVILDVDGVLTDGGIYYDPTGREIKRFHVADGLGIELLRHAGIRVALLSGRVSEALTRRAAELKVAECYQGVRDKKAQIEKLRQQWHMKADELLYVGDDLNDLPAFEAVGVRVAVANAVAELKERAHYTTQASGGNGAVREVCEWLLQARGERQQVIEKYLQSRREGGSTS